jgi:hypothetical protein
VKRRSGVAESSATPDLLVCQGYRCPVVTCDMCGQTAEEADVALHWTTAVERGQKRFFCEVCSRKHLRAMESKLDSEWW